MVGRVEVAAEGVGVAEGAGFACKAAFGCGAAHSVSEGAAASGDRQRIAVDAGVLSFCDRLQGIDKGFGRGLISSRKTRAIDDRNAAGGYA